MPFQNVTKKCMFIAHLMLFRVPVAMLYCEGSSTKPHRHIATIHIWKIIMIRCGKIERGGSAYFIHYNGNIRWRMSRGWFNAHAFFLYNNIRRLWIPCCSLVQEKRSSTKICLNVNEKQSLRLAQFFLARIESFRSKLVLLGNSR